MQAVSGSSSISAHEKSKIKKLMSFRIIVDNLLYIIGVPKRFANERLIASKEFCGQYGNPRRIVINHNPKDDYSGQVAVYVHYDSPLEVALALKVSHQALDLWAHFHSGLL